MDPKLQARLRPYIARVLILEENAAYARMVADMFRVLGSDNIIIETDDRSALPTAKDLEPHIVVVEYGTSQVNGLEFTRTLRRSPLLCRRAPVLMMKSAITATQLAEARNAGVHEVLSKPFAWQDLVSRLQNVLFKPRDWIEAQNYVGPDRRRFNTAEFKGDRKRKGEKAANQVALEESVRLLKAAVDLYDQTPEDSGRVVFQQLGIMVPVCKTLRNKSFIENVGKLVAIVRAGQSSRETLEPIVNAMMIDLGMIRKAPSLWARDLFLSAMEEAEAAKAKEAEADEQRSLRI